MDQPGAVKLCIYCGTDNPASRRDCVVCHHDLLSEEAVANAQDELLPEQSPADVSGFALKDTVENGFSYPDWKSVIAGANVVA